MKGFVLGTVGVVGVGAAVVAGPGGGPDDYVGIVSKPPSVVYAAFSSLGQAGEEVTRTHDGGSMVQRVTKVQDEQLMLELEVDGETMLSAEVQLAPEGEGTRIAAELDVNMAAIRRATHEAGQSHLAFPRLPMEDYLIDQVFAQAMREIATRIEQGVPLKSLAATRDGWKSEGNGFETFEASSSSRTVPPQQSASPQMTVRPAIDPDEAARMQQWRNKQPSTGY